MKKRKHKNQFVTLWDEPSNTYTQIPKSELAPGMVQCHLQGRKGLVWREAASFDLSNSSYRHPPFEGTMRSMIESVVHAFPGLQEWSYEKWEDLLRKNTNPDREIRYWLITARVFREFAEGRTMEHRKEIFQLLTVCNVTPQDSLTMVFEKKLLSADEVDSIAESYYGHFAK